MQIADMHMHAGFAADPISLARELEDAGVYAFSNAVIPDEFRSLGTKMGEYSMLRQGLGLHPWWIEEKTSLHAMLETFDAALPDAAFIGEVGLDFYGTHAQTRDLQLEAFDHIISACAKGGGYLISMHSVRAEREVLDMLEESGCADSCTCILHSYSGPSDQLKRSVDLGCLFSFGPRMLGTKKGREYARILPIDALLLETDLPEDDGTKAKASVIAASLHETLTSLARIRECDVDALADAILRTSLRVLKL